MEPFLPITTRSECHRIHLKDILYIEQDGRQVSVITETATHVVYGKLRDYESFLDRRFYHCLKTTIINLDQVESMKEQTVYFQNGITIYLGRKNFILTRQAFAAHLHAG